MLISVDVALGGIRAVVMVVIMGVVMLRRGSGAPTEPSFVDHARPDIVNGCPERSGEPVCPTHRRSNRMSNATSSARS